MHDNTVPGARTVAHRWAAARRGRTLLLAPAAAAILVASAGTAGTAGAIEPTPVPEPIVPIPSPTACLSLTAVNSFKASGGPFEGGIKLTWNVTAACSVTVHLGGEVVPAAGSKVVDPDKGAGTRSSCLWEGFPSS